MSGIDQVVMMIMMIIMMLVFCIVIQTVDIKLSKGQSASSQFHGSLSHSLTHAVIQGLEQKSGEPDATWPCSASTINNLLTGQGNTLTHHTSR